jgi:3-oxoacid CoA-transferase
MLLWPASSASVLRQQESADSKAEASKTVIVEAEEIVEIGQIEPEHIHLPGLYVNRLFRGAKYEHKIEVLKNSNKSSDKCAEDTKNTKNTEDPRELIAHIAAQEFRTGMNCNLGVGIPTMAAGFAASMGIHVFLQSENGMTGCGPYPEKGKEDSDWINAGKESVTALPGASTFGSDESFGQIRGGHLDMTVLGVGLQSFK